MQDCHMLSPEMQKVLALYNEGLALYKKRDFAQASSRFREALGIQPEDGPSKLYLERCDIFIKTPPPADWDGVFTMTTK